MVLPSTLFSSVLAVCGRRPYVDMLLMGLGDAPPNLECEPT
jgi:hypothetical protein